MAMAEVRPKMRTRNSRGSTHSKSSKNQNQIAIFLQLVLKLRFAVQFRMCAHDRSLERHPPGHHQQRAGPSPAKP